MLPKQILFVSTMTSTVFTSRLISSFSPENKNSLFMPKFFAIADRKNKPGSESFETNATGNIVSLTCLIFY